MRLLRSVSLRLFGLSLAIVTALAVTVVLLQNVIQREAVLTAHENKQTEQVATLHRVQAALSNLRQLNNNLASALLVRNTAWQTQARQSLVEARTQFELELSALELFAPETASELRAGLNEMPDVQRKAVAAMLGGRYVEAEQHARQMQQYAQAVEQSLEEVERQQVQAYAGLREASRRAAENSVYWAQISTVAAFLLGILLILTVSRSLVRPLRRMVATVRRVSAGEADVVIPVPHSPEFGDISHALNQFRDEAEKLRTIAYRDPLTGLANHARLDEALSSGIIKCARTGTGLAVLFLDLDDLKSVNASLGHGAGDRFLREAAHRLQQLVPEPALVCRYSGDKFTVMIEGLRREESERLRLQQVAEAILRGMVKPYRIGAAPLYLTASIGIAVYPTNGQSAEQVLSSADAAMYLAKRRGRNNVQFANADLTDAAHHKLMLVGDIRRGLAANEFEPYYQPIVNTQTGGTVGAEALLRWRHPRRGTVAAAEFIPVAEESDLIGDLGEQCLIRAYQQALHWCQKSPEMPVSVNLSARQLQDHKVLSRVQELELAQSLRPGLLEFEITESAMMERPEQSQRFLQEIRQHGHRLCIDDFGTGHSALSYLQRFPIDRIKIDRSFVAQVESSRTSRAIVSATIALANSLGLDVVAEGVESAAQQQYLKELGCVLQQGYYFARPLPSEEFETWLKARLH
ncbi:MAG: EAL domain-containing protein [Nevskiales bacterium]|nr:EAL domain-containing protein [Nevskiales bacterium]